MIPPHARDAAIGDLDEEFEHDIVPRLGAARARRWYWLQAFSLARAFSTGTRRASEAHDQNVSGRKSTPSTKLKIALVAPMPRARTAMVIAEYPGLRISIRSASRMSWRIVSLLEDRPSDAAAPSCQVADRMRATDASESQALMDASEIVQSAPKLGQADGLDRVVPSRPASARGRGVTGSRRHIAFGFEPIERDVKRTSRDRAVGPPVKFLKNRRSVGVLACLQDGEQDEQLEFAEGWTVAGGRAGAWLPASASAVTDESRTDRQPSSYGLTTR